MINIVNNYENKKNTSHLQGHCPSCYLTFPIQETFCILTSYINGGGGKQEQKEEARDYAAATSVLGTELFPGEADV